MADNRALKKTIRRRMDETGEKYTEARRAVLAQTASADPDRAPEMPLFVQEAERLGHNYIGCEHLLLGILADAHEPAAKVLVANGVTLEFARHRVNELCDDATPRSARWIHSPRSTVVRKLAEVEAERLGQLSPSHGHTLLAMLTEGEGVPMHLLNEVGVDLAKLREDLLRVLDVPDDVRQIYVRQRVASEQEQARRRSGTD